LSRAYKSKTSSPCLRAEASPDLSLTTNTAAAATRQERPGDEAFRVLVESVKDYAIFMLDPTGVITTWNAGAERLKGYRAVEIIGKHFSTFYPDAEVAAGKPDRELEIASAEGRYEEEGWRVRKDGSLFWANVVITAVYDRDATLRGFAKVTRDLTERRRAEQERIELAHAQEAIRIRDEFLSIASHELRTPLNALLLHAAALEILIRRAFANQADADALADKAVSISKQGRRLEELIAKLLDVTRLSTGKLSITPELVDLVKIVQDEIATYLPEAERSGCVVRLSAPPRVRGFWDPLRLAQIVTNLLSNALKFGRRNPIDITVQVDGNTVQITVRDRGIGIAPAEQSRIFQRFERGTSPPSYGGLGLGLYIVERLAQAHGGSVRVESIVGEGSTFTVELPITADASERIANLSTVHDR
jgi:PAS domain S-box-containing protein